MSISKNVDVEKRVNLNLDETGVEQIRGRHSKPSAILASDFESVPKNVILKSLMKAELQKPAIIELPDSVVDLPNYTATKHWEQHFRHYDQFQLAYSKYCAMLRFHQEAMVNKDKVLDAGAGTGNLTVELLANLHHVVAVDSNATALEILKEKCLCNADRLAVINCDLSQPLPFSDEMFDGIACSLVVPFVDPESFLLESFRLLRPGGIISLSVAMTIPDGVQNLMADLERELLAQQILPAHETEWQRLRKTTSANAHAVEISGMTSENLLTMLNQIGFSSISFHESPYGEVVAFVTAEKG